MKTTGREQGGRFRKGVSGNPAGRPRGSRNRSTELLRELMQEGGEAVVRKLVEQAKSGDRVAIRLVVDRIVPRVRDEHVVRVGLPEMQDAGDLVAALGAVLRSVAAGEMTLEEARQFAGILETQRKAMETADLAVRLEALERAEGWR